MWAGLITPPTIGPTIAPASSSDKAALELSRTDPDHPIGLVCVALVEPLALCGLSVAAASELADSRSVFSAEAGRPLEQGGDSVGGRACAGWRGPLRFDPGQQRLRSQRTDSSRQRRRASTYCRTRLGAVNILAIGGIFLSLPRVAKSSPSVPMAKSGIRGNAKTGCDWPEHVRPSQAPDAKPAPQRGQDAYARAKSVTAGPSRSPSRSHLPEVGNRVGHSVTKSVTKSVTR